MRALLRHVITTLLMLTKRLQKLFLSQDKPFKKTEFQLISLCSSQENRETLNLGKSTFFLNLNWKSFIMAAPRTK